MSHHNSVLSCSITKKVKMTHTTRSWLYVVVLSRYFIPLLTVYSPCSPLSKSKRSETSVGIISVLVVSYPCFLISLSTVSTSVLTYTSFTRPTTTTEVLSCRRSYPALVFILPTIINPVSSYRHFTLSGLNPSNVSVYWYVFTTPVTYEQISTTYLLHLPPSTVLWTVSGTTFPSSGVVWGFSSSSWHVLLSTYSTWTNTSPSTGRQINVIVLYKGPLSLKGSPTCTLTLPRPGWCVVSVTDVKGSPTLISDDSSLASSPRRKDPNSLSGTPIPSIVLTIKGTTCVSNQTFCTSTVSIDFVLSLARQRRTFVGFKK